MSFTSCIRHPESTRYIQLHEWQVRFCQSNHCAALLLSYFSAWHDWKLRNDQYYRKSNDIADMHGDGRPNNENAYLFFTTEELIDGCMGLYGKKAVCDGIDLLVSLDVLSVHKNPNPRYHFDKTKYFQFYPKVCNLWIATNYPIDGEINVEHIDSSDTPKMADRESKNDLRSGENSRPSGETSQAITNNTNNTTNKNQSINSRDDLCQKNKSESVANLEEVITAMTAAGFHPEKFNYADAKHSIKRLIVAGATTETFLTAFSVASATTQGNGFGVNYLVKVVESLLRKSNRKESIRSTSGDCANQSSKTVLSESREYAYQHQVDNIKSWAGDLIK